MKLKETKMKTQKTYPKDLVEFIKKTIESIYIGTLTIHIKAHHKEEYNRIIDHTEFLRECKFSERLYCIYHNISSRPICPVCSKGTLKFIDFNLNYRYYC